jgi:hypothetical protein
MTLEQIAILLDNRVKELQQIKQITEADGGSMKRISEIESKILETQQTLADIIEAIDDETNL